MHLSLRIEGEVNCQFIEIIHRLGVLFELKNGVVGVQLQRGSLGLLGVEGSLHFLLRVALGVDALVALRQADFEVLDDAAMPAARDLQRLISVHAVGGRRLHVAHYVVVRKKGLVALHQTQGH